VVVRSEAYFGPYYQDIQKRVPAITAARRQLGWNPRVDLPTAIRRTLDYHLAHQDYRLE
jgi:nucleoside-diphosphate-sugar epimerase